MMQINFDSQMLENYLTSTGRRVMDGKFFNGIISQTVLPASGSTDFIPGSVIGFGQFQSMFFGRADIMATAIKSEYNAGGNNEIRGRFEMNRKMETNGTREIDIKFNGSNSYINTDFNQLIVNVAVPFVVCNNFRVTNNGIIALASGYVVSVAFSGIIYVVE